MLHALDWTLTEWEAGLKREMLKTRVGALELPVAAPPPRAAPPD